MKKILWIAVLAGSSVFADALGEGKAALERHEYVPAAEAFERACEGGNAEGCFELGTMYEKGTGMAPNPYHASNLYAAACRAGMSKGCASMAVNVTP